MSFIRCVTFVFVFVSLCLDLLAHEASEAEKGLALGSRKPDAAVAAENGMTGSGKAVITGPTMFEVGTTGSGKDGTTGSARIGLGMTGSG